MLIAAVKNHSATSGPLKALIIAVSCVFSLLSSTVCIASPDELYPAALMNWMVEGTFYALIADKAEQKLNVWRVKDGEPNLIDSFKCSTGENDGDKWVRGDMKTPEGVYFFCSLIDGKTLPPKYGPWAFTTDYPNFVDRRRGKNGDGIWLHGRDKPLAAKPDSNGCIALENQDLVKVSRYIRLQSTPLIVVDKTRMVPRSVVMEQERELRNFIESWRQSWEAKSLERYMDHYSPNFQSGWFDYRGWKEKKRRLSKKYGNIKVKLGNVFLYRQNGIITSIFTQSYSTDGFESFGVKLLYLTDHGKYQIYAEDYHQAVDDVCPITPLLARYGEDTAPVTVEKVEKKDYKIRLVSTDEPDIGPITESDTLAQVPHKKNLVLEKVAFAANREATVPLEINDKFIIPSSPQRMIITRISADDGASTGKTGDAATDTDLDFSSENRRTAGVLVIPEPAVRLAKDASQPILNLTSARSNVASPTENEEKNAEIQFDRAASEGSHNDNKSLDKKIITDFLHQWKNAWEKKDLDRFMKMYHPEFAQGDLNYKTLRTSKKNFFRKYQTIRIDFDRVDIKNLNNQTEVTFIQTFQGDTYRDRGRKVMVLDIGQDKKIRILSEDWTPLQGTAANTGS